jgi:TolA-binding protein
MFRAEASNAETRVAKPEGAIATPPMTDGSGLLSGSPGGNAAPSSSGSTLSSEIGAIDYAKRALASGNAGEALRRIDAYRAAFPGGVLAAEATALRVEALVRAGRLDEARAELARLRVSYPHSPLLENLSDAVGE